MASSSSLPGVRIVTDGNRRPASDRRRSRAAPRRRRGPRGIERCAADGDNPGGRDVAGRGSRVGSRRQFMSVPRPIGPPDDHPEDASSDDVHPATSQSCRAGVSRRQSDGGARDDRRRWGPATGTDLLRRHGVAPAGAALTTRREAKAGRRSPRSRARSRHPRATGDRAADRCWPG